MKRTLYKERFIVALLALLLVFVSCFVYVTGAWFTDEENIGGGATEPVISPKVYTYSGDAYGELGEAFYWNNSTYNSSLIQPIYIRIDNNTNVTNLVFRIEMNVIWGDLNGSTFTADTNYAYYNNILTPDNTDSTTFATNWTQGYRCEYQAMYNKLIDLGFTTTDAEAQATALFNQSNSYYYYNNIFATPVATFATTPSYIPVYSAMSFNSTDYPNYALKTAKITVTVEADFASTQTTGIITSGSLTTAGKWSPIDSDSVRLDGAPDDWITSITSQL